MTRRRRALRAALREVARGKRWRARRRFAEMAARPPPSVVAILRVPWPLAPREDTPSPAGREVKP